MTREDVLAAHLEQHKLDAEERKEAATDVLFHYSKFVLACMGKQLSPCHMRMLLKQEASGMPTSVKQQQQQKQQNQPFHKSLFEGSSGSSSSGGGASRF